MTPKLDKYGIYVENNVLKGEGFSVKLDSIRGVSVQNGKQYALRAWLFFGATSGLILTAASFVGPIIFMYLIIVAITSPLDVVIKTTEGDMPVESFHLNLFTSKQKANELKLAFDAVLFCSGTEDA